VLQLLLYPALDDQLATPSMQHIADRRTITREFMQDRWRDYLGPDGQSSPYAVPARAEDVAGLPPTLLLAAEFDPLRDEAMAYALRLWHAAVSCELHVLTGVIHGFDAIAPDAPEAHSAQELVMARLRRVVSSG
jgi:acetyl esterase/lipase